ncbi:MAG: TonB-dependent receptor [Phaeodactylibacter sp.]|nr:TonB-dependent receptor [Phaeodactylibacter sp.]MCB9048052.1 TonB-dependent receptor [Lewinellaceae bacterium]
MKKGLLLKWQWFLVLALSGQVLQAQSRCDITLKGKVVDAHTQEPVAFANVAIQGSNIGAMADENGVYAIDSICEGVYIIVCSHVNCDHAEHQVVLTEDTQKDFVLEQHGIFIEEVVVKGKAELLKATGAGGTLDASRLGSERGLSLGDAIEKLPGVTVLNTGSTIAKPVIQGLHSNRVLLLNNGVRQEGQQWGNEHAPEIDPFLADKATVIKGAGSVRYGADAIGGVILVEPRPLREKQGIGGELNLQGLSNGRTGLVSGMLEGRLSDKIPVSGRIQGTAKRGGNLQTPNYYLDNTGVEELNFSWALGMKKENWNTELFFSRFYTRLGIFSGAHIGNLTDLMNAIGRERPLQDGAFSYELGRPQQRIYHELFKWKGALETGEKGTLQLQLARQFNRRQEYDAHRPYGNLPDNFDEPQIEFEITTHTAELSWEHNPIRRLRGTIGAHFMQQANTTDRGALIPNYENYTAGAFWIERWKNYPSPLEVEAGLRYDYQWMDVGIQGQDTINRQLDFSNLSGTVGAIYRFPKLVELRFNIGTAWRAPNVNELFSDGVHHGAASFETGDPNMRPERAYNNSLTIELDDKDKLNATLNFFYNVIDDFIFLEPQPQPVLTIRGAFPAFRYAQSDARLMGLDWQLAYELMPALQVESQASLLNAWNRSRKEYLSLMPPAQFEHALRYSFGEGEKGKNAPYLRLAMINVLEQTRVPEGTDYAPPPPGHTRFKLEGGAQFRLSGQPLEVSLAVFNLFNTSYRQYLNRFRYFADETGRNVSVHLRVPFGKEGVKK